IAIDFTCEGNVRQIPEMASIALFRVLQEALSNLAKHSGAGRGTVVINVEGHQALLRVKDRGRGFDLEGAESKAGLGLISMSERLRLVGGTIKVTSSPGQGTDIEAAVPLNSTSKYLG